MSVPLLDLPALDELQRRLGSERFRRVLTAQMTNGQALIRRLVALEISPDPAQVKTVAHQIAGSSGSVGLRRLGGQAALLERTLAGAEPPAFAVLAALVRDLRHCLELSQAALRAEFPEI
jgi:HPt (histidine-containing phosphotransfer) domain-containing protein